MSTKRVSKMKSSANMSFEEYGKHVNKIVEIAHKHKITYQTGRQKGQLITSSFCKKLFGIKRSAHSQLLRGTYKRKSDSPVPPPVQQAIRFLSQLTESRLVKEIIIHRDLYEQDRYS